MTDSLRDQIGRMLSDVGELVLNTYDVGHFTRREDASMAHDILMAQADEVIRLMEWAYLTGGSNADGMAEPWPTLPPEDWKP